MKIINKFINQKKSWGMYMTSAGIYSKSRQFFFVMFLFIVSINFSCVGLTEYFLDDTSMEVGDVYSQADTAGVQALSLKASYPLLDGSTSNFPNNSAVIVQFSNSINTSTVFVNTDDTTCSGSIQVSSDDFATCVQFDIGYGVSVSNNYTSFTVKPNGNLTDGVSYKLKITTDVEDVNGLALGDEVIIDFTVGASDSTAPTVVSVSPISGDVNVEPTTTISITFSEVMDRATVESSFSLTENIGGTAISGTFSWNENTVTFTPSIKLKFYEYYDIEISTSAKDLAGNSFSSTQTSSFQTRDIWDTLAQINNDSVDAGGSMITDAGNIYVAWSEGSASKYLYAKKYENGSFAYIGGEVNINAGSWAQYPSMYLDGSTPYVTYVENSKIYTNYYNTSTWESYGTELTPYCSPDGNGTINALFDSKTYLIWSGSGCGDNIVETGYYNGSDWDTTGDIFTQQAESDTPKMLKKDNDIYISYLEHGTSTNAKVRMYSTGTWADINSWVELGSLMNETVNSSSDIDIAFNGNNLYVAYTEDNADGKYDLFVKKWNGSSWDVIGSNLDFGDAPESIDISIVNGEVYVAWEEYSANSIIYLKKWNADASHWDQVGASVNKDKNNDAKYPVIADWNGSPIVLIQQYNGSTNDLLVMQLRY